MPEHMFLVQSFSTAVRAAVSYGVLLSAPWLGRKTAPPDSACTALVASGRQRRRRARGPHTARVTARAVGGAVAYWLREAAAAASAKGRQVYTPPLLHTAQTS